MKAVLVSTLVWDSPVTGELQASTVTVDLPVRTWQAATLDELVERIGRPIIATMARQVRGEKP